MTYRHLSSDDEMTEIVKPTPLEQQIVHALKVLREARAAGDVSNILTAEKRFDRLLDRYMDKSTSLR